MTNSKPVKENEVKNEGEPCGIFGKDVPECKRHGSKCKINLPRIFGGNCEFCGIRALECPHHGKRMMAEMRDANVQKLVKDTLAEITSNPSKYEEHFEEFKEGSPRVTGENCDFCGIRAFSCKHYGKLVLEHIKEKGIPIIDPEARIEETMEMGVNDKGQPTGQMIRTIKITDKDGNQYTPKEGAFQPEDAEEYLGDGKNNVIQPSQFDELMAELEKAKDKEALDAVVAKLDEKLKGAKLKQWNATIKQMEDSFIECKTCMKPKREVEAGEEKADICQCEVEEVKNDDDDKDPEEEKDRDESDDDQVDKTADESGEVDKKDEETPEESSEEKEVPVKEAEEKPKEEVKKVSPLAKAREAKEAKKEEAKK